MKRHTLKKTTLAMAIALATSIGSAMSVSAATETAGATVSSTAQPKETVETTRKLLAEKDKLKLAEILGYGGKDDYKQLYNAIDDIKDVIHTEKSAAAWDKIKTSLATLKNKIIHPGK